MSVDTEMEEEIKEEEVVISWKKEDVFMSPQDVSIECKGEQIRTHSVVLRRCAYFAAILDNVELDSGSDNTKIIPLPDAFYHDPNEVRKFVVAHYFTLDEADAAQLKQQISKENVVSLAQLSHYFDSPVLLAACDESLASNHFIWFPGSLLLMAQVAIKNHLPLLRATCAADFANNSEETRLLVHLDQGRSVLCKDPAFVSELITVLNQKHVSLAEMYHKERAAIKRDGPRLILGALGEHGLISDPHGRAKRIVEGAFAKIYT
jgi:hypothetical protein